MNRGANCGLYDGLTKGERHSLDGQRRRFSTCGNGLADGGTDQGVVLCHPALGVLHVGVLQEVSWGAGVKGSSNANGTPADRHDTVLDQINFRKKAACISNNIHRTLHQHREIKMWTILVVWVLCHPCLAAKSAPRGLTGEPIVKRTRLQDVSGCGNSEYLLGGLGAACVLQGDIGTNEA